MGATCRDAGRFTILRANGRRSPSKIGVANQAGSKGMYDGKDRYSSVIIPL
ncbi:MAG: hypothetical protein LIP08_11245 [Bacteroides sp.]|nr:hypothetical protein [Bacteroides sp.]